jgi:magnesium transporter
MVKINLVEEEVKEQPKYKVDNGKHTAILKLHNFDKDYEPYLIKVVWEDGGEKVDIISSPHVLEKIKTLLIKRESPMDVIWCLLQYEYKTLDRLEERVEKLQNASLHNYSQEILRDVLKIKKTLFIIHRDYIRMRNTLEWLSEEEGVHPLLRDINELIYAIEYLIDGTTLAIQLMQNTLSVKMNQTMKILTVIATIMMPLTLITGIYGMNFVNMPEIKWEYGYYYSLLLMLGIAILMLYYFKRKKLL